MKMPKHSLRKIVTFLNDPEEDGGFWLPNIQRSFVWSEEQICRLYDSILREYPISTLLIWKTRSPIRLRKFIDNYRHGCRLTDLYVPEDDHKKCLVLDGQQRLQSLFIGLRGSYEDRELYLDILSGDVALPEDVKYRFSFLDPAVAGFPWIKFKSLVFSKDDPLTAAKKLIASVPRPLLPEEESKISKHVGVVFKTFQGDDGIAYQELDSIENSDLYSDDDVVEIFIRANSGGTRLGKSDLLFSLLNARWDSANEQMEDLLEELNRSGFAFTRDFVLKTCLTLLDKGARYEVYKFRTSGIREQIETNWERITAAIKDVLDFVIGKTFVRCDKAMPSYLALIPLVYFRYHFSNLWNSAKDRDLYLIRSLLAGAFSGTPDRLIDACVSEINQMQRFDVSAMFEVIRSQGRSLELTEERFWNLGYGSDTVHLIFNLWYQSFNYVPAYSNNLPQVDHVFPQSALRKIKTENLKTGRLDLVKYKESDRNQLANCMLLTAQENGAGGKGDSLPDAWFAGKPDSYLEMHHIPKDPSLWQLTRFDDFIQERKALLRKAFQQLLAPTAVAAVK